MTTGEAWLPASAAGRPPAEREDVYESSARRLEGMRYDVFISYSHTSDAAVAVALQKGLERLARPLFRLRSLDVFRDDTGLDAHQTLSEGIAQALERSRFFLLVCSPDAAGSPWVQEEVRLWTERNGFRRLLLARTAGEAAWNRTLARFDPSTTAIPPLLERQLREEPLLVDLTWARDCPPEQLTLRDPRFNERVAQLAASPVHPGRDAYALQQTDQRQLRRRKQAWAAAALVFVLLALALAGALWNVDRQRDLAEARQRIAQSRQLAAEANLAATSEPDLAMLLALESVELESDVVARNSLLSVVSSPNLPLRHLPPGTPGPVVLAGAPEAPMLVSGHQSGRLVVMDDVLEQIGGDGIDNLAPDGVVDAVLVPGGAALFVGSRNGDIIRYDRTPTGWQERLVFEGAGTVLDMAIEPATAALAVSYSRGTVVTLAPTTAEPQEWACAPSPTALAFESPGVLIAGDAEGRLYRFDLGEPVDGCLVTATGADRPGAAVIAIVREQASGDWLVARRATVVERYGPQLERAPGGEIRVGGPTLLTSISVDQGGNEVALGTADGVVRFVALDTGEETRPPIRGHDAEVSALAQAGEHVVSAGSDGSIVVWPARSASRLATELFARPGEEVRGLAVAEASGTLVAGRQDGTVLGWDDVARPWASLSVAQSPSSIRALDITADASRIAVGQADGRVTVLQRAGDGTFALVAQTLAETLPGGEVKALAFTPDGSGLVSGHESGLVEVRSLPHLELLHSVSNPETTVRAIAMTEAAFYIGWLNGEIEGWSTGPRANMVWQAKADDSLESLAVMEDHNVLVSGHESGVVEFRSISDRNVEDRFQGVHRSPVRSIAVHEGGPYLATAERNGRIVLWDARRRERFPTPLDGHTDDLRNITFAPDGLALFSAGYDGRVLRWELDLERWKHLACRSAGRPMTDRERSRFNLEDNGDERACP